MAVGLVLVALVAVGAAFGLSRLRGGPNLGHVVYVTKEGVFSRDLATGSRERLADLPGDTLDTWPDREGRWLGYLRRGGSLWLVDLSSGSRWRVSDRLSTGLGWDLDGRFLAAELLSDRDVVAIDPDARGTDLLVSGYAGGVIVWRDRDHFYTSIGDDVVTIRLSGDRPFASKVADDAWPLALSPDGRELLYVSMPGSERSRVVIGDVREDALGAKRTVFNGMAYRAAVSPQGFVSFSGRDRSDKGGTWVLESRGRAPRRISLGQAELMAWSLDGASLIYVVNGSLYARDFREDRAVRLSTRGDYVKAFSVVP